MTTTIMHSNSNQSSRSLLSSHPSDMVSIPSSSCSRATSVSFDDSLEPLSDPDEHHSPHTGFESDHHPHPPGLHPSPELLTAITHHFVMPRLPILPSNHSTPPLHPPLSEPPSSSQNNHSPHHPRASSTPRFLLIGDAHSAHGLGALDNHLSALSSSSPPLNHLHRLTDTLPQFKLSDPSTYDSLIQLIESPFIRLKELLNPKFFYHHHTFLPTPTRDDLLSVVNSWIEREGFLLLLIEIRSFPLPAETLELILTLSRLIPTIPYIPSDVPAKQAVDGQAILTRQLVSKRIRHFSVPKPDHYQRFMFPSREECLVRSSKCYLDWLTVEFAASQPTIHPPPPPEDGEGSRGRSRADAGRRAHPRGGSSEDDHEPDRWSEKVSVQMRRRRGKEAGGPRRRRSLLGRRGKIVEELVRIHDPPAVPPGRRLHAAVSQDAFGLPSLSVLVSVGLRQLHAQLHAHLRSFSRSLVHSLLVHSHPPPTPSHRPHLDLPRASSPLPHSAASTWVLIGLVTATTAATLSVWYRNRFFFF